MKTKFKASLKILSELSKVRITFLVSLTTMVGWLLYQPAFTWDLLILVLGLFILASGSATLNQFQEHDTDAKMPRTQNRPIPSGRISAEGALTLAISMTIFGSTLIYVVGGFLAMQLGILTLIWYNAVYTPLKKKTAFAVVPGSLIGALPPLIGWVAAGGNPTDTTILLVAFFMFIWQIPHFWLLLLKYGEQYKKAGFPSLPSVYGKSSLKKVTFVWILATAVSGLFFPFFKVSSNLVVSTVLVISSLLLVGGSVGLLKETESLYTKKHFMQINLYLLIIIIALSTDAFL